MDVLGAFASQQLHQSQSSVHAHPGGFHELFEKWRASFASSTNEILNQNDPFGDGDQRTYHSMSAKGTELVSTWADGADAGIWQSSPESPPLYELIPVSPFMRACALGNLAMVQKEIAAMKAATEAAVAHPVAGASEPVTTAEAAANPVALPGKQCSVCKQSLEKERYSSSRTRLAQFPYANLQSNTEWNKPDSVRKCKTCVEKVETTPQLPVIVEEKKVDLVGIC